MKVVLEQSRIISNKGSVHTLDKLTIIENFKFFWSN